VDATSANYAAYNTKWLTYHDGAKTKSGDTSCTDDANEKNCIPKNKIGCLAFEFDSAAGKCTMIDGSVSATPDDSKADTKCYNRKLAVSWATAVTGMKALWIAYMTLKVGDYKGKKDALTSKMNTGWGTFDAT